MIKLGIIGTGSVSHWHFQEFSKIKDVRVVAACDTNKKVLKQFSKQYKIKKTFLSVDDLLANPDVDAIINTTPDKFHKEVAIKALNNGKHIFSEKPLAENYKDAREMYRVAKSTELINMVNFSYRNSPGLQKMNEIIKSRKLGNIKHVEASYFQSWLTSGYWGNWRENPLFLWRLSTKHGSTGVLGDLGVHLFDFVTYPAGEIKKIFCYLKTYKDKGQRVGDYILDANDSFLSIVKFKNGSTGVISSTRVATGYKNKLKLKIFCDKGALRIQFDDPIKEGNSFDITKNIESEEMSWEKRKASPTPNNFERFINSIKSGINEQPDFKRGAKIQKILDSCIESSKKKTWIKI